MASAKPARPISCHKPAKKGPPRGDFGHFWPQNGENLAQFWARFCAKFVTNLFQKPAQIGPILSPFWLVWSRGALSRPKGLLKAFPRHFRNPWSSRRRRWVAKKMGHFRPRAPRGPGGGRWPPVSPVVAIFELINSNYHHLARPQGPEPRGGTYPWPRLEPRTSRCVKM